MLLISAATPLMFFITPPFNSDNSTSQSVASGLLTLVRQRLEDEELP